MTVLGSHIRYRRPSTAQCARYGEALGVVPDWVVVDEDRNGHLIEIGAVAQVSEGAFNRRWIACGYDGSPIVRHGALPSFPNRDIAAAWMRLAAVPR